MKVKLEEVRDYYIKSLMSIVDVNNLIEVYPTTVNSCTVYNATTTTYIEDGVRLFNDRTKNVLNSDPMYGIIDSKCDPKLLLSFMYVSKFTLKYDEFKDFTTKPNGKFVFNIYKNPDRNKNEFDKCRNNLVYEKVEMNPAYRVFNHDEIDKVRIVHLAQTYTNYALNDILSNMNNLFTPEKTDYYILLNPDEIIYAPLVADEKYSNESSIILSTTKIYDDRLFEKVKTDKEYPLFCCFTKRD